MRILGSSLLLFLIVFVKKKLVEAISLLNSELFLSTLLFARQLAGEVGKVGTYKSWFEVCLMTVEFVMY